MATTHLNLSEVPRIRARTGQGDDEKWYFEVSMWNIAGTEMIGGSPLGTFGPFETESQAKGEMRRAVQICCQAIEGPNGEKPEGYIDFKNGGEFRKFEEN